MLDHKVISALKLDGEESFTIAAFRVISLEPPVEAMAPSGCQIRILGLSSHRCSQMLPSEDSSRGKLLASDLTDTIVMKSIERHVVISHPRRRELSLSLRFYQKRSP